MIIREYREITKKSEDYSDRYLMQKKVNAALNRFDVFHLREESMRVLESYIRYISKGDHLKRKISYNFMIHCSDDYTAMLFIAKLTEVVNNIKKISERAKVIPEKDFLNNPSKAMEVLEESKIFVINRCMCGDEFAPNSRTSRMDDIIRHRNEAWKDFVSKCELTPQVCKIIVANEDTIRERFINDYHLYNRVFRNHIYIDDLSVEDVCALTMMTLKNSGLDYSEEFRESIRKYINLHNKRQMTFCSKEQEEGISRASEEHIGMICICSSYLPCAFLVRRKEHIG